MDVPFNFKMTVIGLALALVFPLSGCSKSGGDVAPVTGTVKMDGAPLPNALVTFTPTAGGSPSYGRTDQGGLFTLQYTRGVAGAVVGEHRVIISTQTSGDPDADPPVAASEETVPTQYNSNSELLRNVESGTNTIDFELESQGAIVPIDQQ